MQGNPEPDVWVVARLAALERANRRLWIGLGALAMAFLTLVVVAGLLATGLELPAASVGTGGQLDVRSLHADDVTVRNSLHVVDEHGRDLVLLGREGDGERGRAQQTVIGLYSASASGDAPLQALRMAASPLGAALSLGTPDGASSASLFVAAEGASLELRRGDKVRLVSSGDEGASVARSPAPAAAPAAPPPPASSGARAEGPAVSRAPAGDAARGLTIDLTDGVLQPLGSDFYVGRLALSDSGSGLRVSGRIVNASSVDQLRAEFRLSVANRELPFSVARIGAGNSTPFALEIPKATNAELRDAHIRWVRSTLNYGTE